MRPVRYPPALARSLVAAAVLCATALLWADGEAGAKAFSLTTRAVGGAEVRAPAAGTATVLLFVRTGQDQSAQTVENVKKALAGRSGVAVLAVLSGDQPDKEVSRYAAGLPWHVVRDRDFKVVGQLRVRVWPTAVILLPNGKELVTIAGLPPSYVSDLQAYLDFAAGKIDLKTLQRRLANSSVVSDSPYEMARRHLEVAQRLMEADQLSPALVELDEGLKHQGDDPAILLAKARALLLLGKPRESLKILSGLDQNSALAAGIGVLKGGALAALKRWNEAIGVLGEAVRLNPDPSEGYYFLALAYEHKGQWEQAAGAYRKAYETGHAGRLVARAIERIHAPATQPATRPATAAAG